MFKIYQMGFAKIGKKQISVVLFLVDVGAPVTLQELQISSLRDAVSSTCNLVSQLYVFKAFLWLVAVMVVPVYSFF